MDLSTAVFTIVGSNMAMIVVVLGTTIGMWLHNDKKIEAIQQEMKEFHTRLAVQDLEFKMRLASIEERSRGLK